MIIRYSEDGQNKPTNIIHLDAMKSSTLTMQTILLALTKDGVDIEQYSVRIWEELPMPSKGGWVLLSDNIPKPINGEIQILLKTKASVTKSLQELATQISLLEAKISQLSAKSVEMSLGPSISSVMCSNRKLDIAYFYANPIVCEERNRSFPLENPIDSVHEIEAFLKVLNYTNLDINFMTACGTMEKLISILNRNPRILHISCHGDYSNNTHHLMFEGNNMQLDVIKIEQLKNIIENTSSKDLQLVFVSACHSQAIGQMFQNVGVPYVVAVHSETKILDSIALKFACNFYTMLLNNSTVEEAFESSKNLTAAYVRYCCCCSHLHEGNCPWIQKVNKIGLQKAHEMHFPSCSCILNGDRHISTCQWPIKYALWLGVSDNDINKILKDGRVCCCQPDVPHRENDKFVLLKNEHYTKNKLFEEHIPGKLSVSSFKKENRFTVLGIDKPLIGRNTELYNTIVLLNKENDCRLINIHGPKYSGKTIFVKYLANYLDERSIFPDGVIYVDMKNRAYISALVTSISTAIKTMFHTMEEISNFLKPKSILIIVDKCTKLVASLKSQDDLINYLRDKIIYQTQYIKIIIVSRAKIDRVKDTIQLGALSKEIAAKYIQKCPRIDPIYSDPLSGLELLLADGAELFNRIPLLPTYILKHINPQISSGKSLKEICHNLEITKQKNSEIVIDYSLAENLVTKLTSKGASIEVLQFISLFEKGIPIEHICLLTDKGADFEKCIEDCQSNKDERPLIHIHFLTKDKINVYQVYKCRSTLKEYIKNKYIKDHTNKYKLYVSLFKYVASISRALIKQIIKEDKISTPYNHFDAFADDGIWGAPTEKLHHIDVYENMITPLWELFEKTFNICVNGNGVREAVSEIKAHKFDQELSTFLKYYAELAICYCSLLVYNKRLSEAIDSVNSIIANFPQDLPSEELINTLSMLNILKSDLYFNSYQSTIQDSTVQRERQYLDIIESLKVSPSGDNSTYVEYNLAKYKYIHSDANVGSEEYLKEAYKRSKTDYDKYRVRLAISDLSNAQIEGYDENIITWLNECQEYFLQAKKHRMLIITLIKLSKCYHQQMDLKKSLDYAEKAMKFTTEVNDNLLIDKVKDQLDSIKKLIIDNKICCLKSFPLVCFNEQRNKYLPCQPDIRRPSEFRSKLLDRLHKENKQIAVKFDILNLPNIQEATDSGCKLLHITSDMSNEENSSLIIEQNICISQKIPLGDLKSLFAKSPNQIGLITVAVPSKLNIVKELCAAGIQHVLAFDFSECKLGSIITLRDDLLSFEYEAIYNFCVEFYLFLVQRKTMTEAMLNARIAITASLIKMLQGFNYFDNDSDIFPVGKWPQMYPLEGNHNIQLFKDLPDGIPIDYSPKRCFSNLNKILSPMIGRQSEVFNIIEILQRKRSCLVTGMPGVGKTRIVEEACYALLMRQVFTGGIFFHCWENEDKFKAFIRQTSDNKNDILLFVDDCFKLFSTCTCEHLINYLKKKFNITLVFTTDKKLPKSQLFTDYIYVTPLNEKNSIQFVCAYANRNLREEEEINTKYDSLEAMLKDSEEFERCCGLPGLLKCFSKQLQFLPIHKISFEKMPKKYIKATKENKLLKESVIAAKLISFQKGLPHIDNQFDSDIEDEFDEACSLIIPDTLPANSVDTKLNNSYNNKKPLDNSIEKSESHNNINKALTQRKTKKRKGKKTGGMHSKYGKNNKSKYYNFKNDDQHNSSEEPN